MPSRSRASARGAGHLQRWASLDSRHPLLLLRQRHCDTGGEIRSAVPSSGRPRWIAVVCSRSPVSLLPVLPRCQRLLDLRRPSLRALGAPGKRVRANMPRFAVACPDVGYADLGGISDYDEIPARRRTPRRQITLCRVFYEKTGLETTAYAFATDQFGTQLDPPAHRHPCFPAIDELPATLALRKLAVISIVDWMPIRPRRWS